MTRLLRWFAVAVTALAALVAVTALVLDSDLGHRFVADRVNALAPANGLRFHIGRIDGSLYGKATLVDFRLSDPDGLVLAVPRARLDWNPFAYVSNRLEIAALDIPTATLAKLPRTLDTGKQGPILPDFDIAIGRLRVVRLVVAPRVTGKQREGRIEGRADIRSGHASVDLAALVQGSDRITARIDAVPDAGRFDLDVRARGSANGVLAQLTGLRRAVTLDVGGVGDWQRWRGTARAQAGGARVLDLALGNDAGRYTLTGSITPASITRGKLQSLTAPRVVVNGSARLSNRRLDGTLSMRSAALAAEASGVVDLARSAFDNLRLRARLLRPEALFRNMRAQNMELRAILDGPLRAFTFDYRITAPRFSFDQTGFEQARAAGRGRWSKAPVALPVRFTAARVTGVGNVAGGILRNLVVDGTLRVTSKLVTGDDLRVRSDKLTGRINLQLDLSNGQFDIGVNGALGRFLIPGLGIVDVQSRLSVVPGPGGRGTRVVGRGSAQMVRLDNGFFRSLAGGLPHVETMLERTPDGVLHFTNLVLTAPQIRLAGSGYRRRDGTFHFEGAGRQASYGALTLTLDGQIERPTIDLLFQRPNAALGLSNVRAHLDPTPTGFAFTAAGGSRLGPFTTEGQILLPKGGTARVVIARLDVSGTRAAGALDIVPNGFLGRLTVAGGGLSGTLDFAPQGTIQRIAGALDARAARLGTIAVRQGHVDFTTLLDPAGTRIEATATGSGLRRGSLSVARFAGTAKLNGETGKVRASIAGSRGAGFQIQTVTQITADGYTVQAQGKVGNQPMDMAFHGDELFVPCQGDGSVHVIDIPNRKHKTSFKCGTGCESIGFF